MSLCEAFQINLLPNREYQTSMAQPSMEEVEGVAGAFVVHNVLTPEQCSAYIAMSESMGRIHANVIVTQWSDFVTGYTNETHPKYQNKFIDDKELKNRQNMRLVWEASPQDTGNISFAIIAIAITDFQPSRSLLY